MNIDKPFFIDPNNPGIVRGGFYDELGGMLVGMHAKEVCDILNTHYEKIAVHKEVWKDCFLLKK